MHDRAEGDVNDENEGAERGKKTSLRPENGRREQRHRHDGREVRIEDEHPVQSETVSRKRDQEHDPEGRNPVESEVGRDSEGSKPEERREARVTGVAIDEADENGEEKRKHRKQQERVRPAPVAAEILDAGIQEEHVRVGQHGADESEHERGAGGQTIRQGPRENRPRDSMADGVHAGK